jgi:hypothetical protein
MKGRKEPRPSFINNQNCPRPLDRTFPMGKSRSSSDMESKSGNVNNRSVDRSVDNADNRSMDNLDNPLGISEVQ